MIKTYLDAGVLLTAWRTVGRAAGAALAVIEDPARTFYTSQFLRLELLPKATHFKQRDEVEFYATHFDSAAQEVPLSYELGLKAAELGGRYGLAAADALHIAAALRIGAEEFITTERPEKPMFRVRELNIRCLDLMRD